LNALVYEFLLFSKPAKAVEGSVDVNEVINDTLVVLQNSPEMAKTIEIRKILTDDLRIRIDPQQLQQVIWNLMLNAVQEMKGGGTLSIATAVHSGTDGSEGEKRFRPDLHLRYRPRHSARKSGQDLRSLFHQQGDGDWSWAHHRPSHRRKLPRQDLPAERPPKWYHLRLRFPLSERKIAPTASRGPAA